MRTTTAIAVALMMLTGGAAWAQGQGQGGGQGKGHGKGPPQSHSQGQNPGQGQQPQGGQSRIADNDRATIQAYFGQQFASGNCPPGLAKKNNGCQPPGQARKWAVGQPLPAGIAYPLPPDLLRRLAPPAGYSYMRVGSDILMVAAGTSLVVAGLQDLLR